MSIKGVAVVVLLVTDVVHPCRIEQQLLSMTWYPETHSSSVIARNGRHMSCDHCPQMLDI